MTKQKVLEISDLEIRKSKIEGNGVFAKIQIRKGKTITFVAGEEVNLQGIINLIENGKETPFCPLQVGNLSYIHVNQFLKNLNHSCNPNCFIMGKNELVALRDIEEGEEITFDYSTTMDDDDEGTKKFGEVWLRCKCNCGEKNCRGIIDQFPKIPREIQEFYLKNKLVPDFILKKFQKIILK